MRDAPFRGRPRAWITATLLALPVLLGGCAVLGLAASAVPEGDVPARYKDLRGHSVAVLVWSHRGLETEFPGLRLDLASAVQGRLQAAQKAGRGELKGCTFPHSPASMVRFQEDHPELDRSPIIDVAPRFGVQRLIYIEVENLQTRSEQAVELYRGLATVSLRVVEVDNGKAKVGYEESGQSTTYPPAAPIEGVPNAGDARIYRGTVDQLATIIARRFHAYSSGK